LDRFIPLAPRLDDDFELADVADLECTDAIS